MSAFIEKFLANQNESRGASRLRLRTILRLRWIAIVGQFATVVGVYWWLGFDLPIGICLSVIAVSVWLNIILRLRYPLGLRLRQFYATLMLTYDILQLSLLLYLTGGLLNPFSLLMLAPVSVSAATLPPRPTLVLGVVAIICATLLLQFYLPVPWYHGQVLDLPVLYRVGLWAGIVFSTVFIGFYTWRIAKEARQMSDALAATEMVLGREQKLSELDGLAAAAAHELGTPLSTIAVVAKELERGVSKEDPIFEDIQLLRSQAERCRNILATLTERSASSDEVYMHISLTHMLEEVISPHRSPEIDIDVTALPLPGAPASAMRQPVLVRSSGLFYALGNLLENAVDFARSRVMISASWDADVVTLKIMDDGPGFSLQVLESLGEPYLTTRPSYHGIAPSEESGGMGLGFFIANTFLERTSAKLHCVNRKPPETGAIVEIRWPRRLIDVGGHDA